MQAVRSPDGRVILELTEHEWDTLGDVLNEYLLANEGSAVVSEAELDLCDRLLLQWKACRTPSLTKK